MKYSVSLKHNYEFRRLYSRGKSAAVACLAVYARKNGREASRVGFTVSNKLGKAVCRNRIRRRLREIYRLHEEELARGLDMVVVARMKSRTASYAEMERDFLLACGRLGILKRRKDGC